MIVYCSDISAIEDKPSLISHYESLLSDSEKHRYNGISNRKRRLEFLIGRALIFQACSQSPELLPNGKPVVQNGYISLAHSYPYVVLALSDNPIGVDIENTSRNKPFKQLAKRLHFCLEGDERMSFYHHFTRYEADFKTGCSLEELTHKYYSINTCIICISLLNNKENIEFIKTIPFFGKTSLLLKEET